MTAPIRLSLLAVAATLGGCVTYPTGPSMMALPGSGTTFEQFQADDAQCQAYAQGSVGPRNTQQTASDAGANSAAVGTIVGAAAGALIGAASGDAAAGAAIGGGSGLLLGSAAGTDAYAASGYMAQDRYDAVYVQCMYARGHQVPVRASSLAYQQGAAPYATAPQTVTVPPANPAPGAAYPPPGTPPPPGY